MEIKVASTLYHHDAYNVTFISISRTIYIEITIDRNSFMNYVKTSHFGRVHITRITVRRDFVRIAPLILFFIQSIADMERNGKCRISFALKRSYRSNTVSSKNDINVYPTFRAIALFGRPWRPSRRFIAENRRKRLKIPPRANITVPYVIRRRE